VIFISNIVFEKFRVKGGGVEPFLIRFPEYNREDTIKILQRDFRPSTIQISDKKKEEEDTNMNKEEEGIELDVGFYTYFLEVIYDSLCHNCKDINELRYHAALLFPLYIKPIQEGIVVINEKIKLFKYVQPYIKEAVEKLYLREISSAEWSQETKELDTTVDQDQQHFLTKKIGRAEFELPYYTKFLLIATYLASYNPPKFDVRYFAKASEERKKKKGGGTRKGARVDKLGGKMRQQLLGPKVFPVERMLAIFYSIIDEQIDDTIDIQLQITSLTTLRLLVRSTSIDRLDGAKYKSNVNFEFIKLVAKSVRFEIDKYLYDFC
jgi:origin recognition complex subunit 5